MGIGYFSRFHHQNMHVLRLEGQPELAPTQNVYSHLFGTFPSRFSAILSEFHRAGAREDN